MVSSVAVCPGSGSSILLGVAADLFVTGEMSHHEVLVTSHSWSPFFNFLPFVIHRFLTLDTNSFYRDESVPVFAWP